MSTLVVVGHLVATSKEARQKVLDQFSKIVTFSRSDEPGVLSYAITVPRDETDETSIYAIEEYKDQKVSDDHIASSPVQALISLFGSQPAVLAEAPKVYQLEYTSDEAHYTRQEVKAASDPFIVFATAQQQEKAATAELTETWSAVVTSAQSQEPTTLMYALVRDKENTSQIGTIEAYTDQAAFELHCQSGAVADLISKNKEIGGDMGFVALRMVTGWILR